MKVALALAILCLGDPASLAMKPNDAPIEALLERHLEWLGGRPALERLRSFSAQGTLQTAGLAGTLSLRRTRAGAWRRETRLGALSIFEVRGAAGGWTVNWSGQVETLGAAELATGDRESGWSFGRHLTGGLEAERVDLGVEARDGREWRVVRFRFPGGDVTDLFLDPATGACTWLRKQEDTRTWWVRLGDWRPVGGVRVPFEQQSLHDDPKLDATIRWQSVELDAELPAALFEKPSPRRDPFEIAGGVDRTPWIPAELVEGRYVFLAGRVAGREVSLLLDSGANVSVLDERLARGAGIDFSGRLLMEGAAAGQAAAVAGGITVEVGALRLSDLTVVVTDLSGVEQALGRAVPFILGKEAFNSLVVEIDYPGSRLAFHVPATFQPDPAARSLALVPGEGGNKLVELAIEGHPPALFALDTGSGSAVTLFQSYVEERQLLAGRAPRSERLLRGIGGGSAVTVATLERVTLAGFTLHGVPAEFFAEEAGAFHTRRAAGNLGAGLLDRFHVAFDYGGDRMFLTPGPDWQRPFCKNRGGLEADFRGDHLEVVFVSPGSPASQAGWRVGERVVAIDGMAIGADFLNGPAARWWCGEAGRRVVLTDGEGRGRELVLREYY